MNVTVYCDGSYRKINGVMKGQTGWVAVIPATPPLVVKCKGSQSQRQKSSDDAEWRAVFDAINWVRRIEGITGITIVVDYKTVADAINGISGGRRNHRVDSIAQLVPGVTVKARWVPREQNTIADSLSRTETRQCQAKSKGTVTVFS